MPRRTKTQKICLIILTSIFAFSANVFADNNLTDPYEIYEKHVEMIGGWENIKSVRTSYKEVIISIAGKDQTMKSWEMKPHYNRSEINMNSMTMISGDNGEYLWTLDFNGNPQIFNDENSLKQRQDRIRITEYEFLNPNSESFKLAFSGIKKNDDQECYVILTTNTNVDASSYTFINCNTFLIEKTVVVSPEGEAETFYYDYRDVGGVKYPFRLVTKTTGMDMEFTTVITKFETNIEIDPAIFQPPGLTAKDYHFTKGNSALNVPFEYIQSHLYIKVTVGCKERFWLLDSGASRSFIDSAFAEELGLSQKGDFAGQGVGNNFEFSLVKLPEMSLPGIEFDEQIIGSLNMQTQSWNSDINEVGVLGYDFLSRFVTKIDYANQTLSFYDPETFEYSGQGQTLDAPLKINRLTVPVTVDGKYTGRFLLDTGAGGIFFHYTFANEHDLHRLPGINSMSLGAGGELSTKYIEFDKISLAGYSIADQIITIPIDDFEDELIKTGLSGLIGNAFLRHFNIYLDYVNQKVIIEKGANFEKIFPRNNSGLGVRYNTDKEMVVSFVPENTPVSKAGFKEGDILVSINGISVDLLDGLQAISKLGKAEIGTKYKIVVKRDGKEKELKLKLADIFK